MAESIPQTFTYLTDNAVQSYDPNGLANQGIGTASNDTIGGKSSYDFNTFTFPADLHSNPDRSSHVMMIKINENTIGLNDPGTIVSNALHGGYSQYLNLSGSAPDNKATGTTSFGYTRMKGAIFLYMPPTVQFTNQNQYTDISLTALGKDAISGAASVLSLGAGKEGFMASLFGGVQKAVSSVASGVGNIAAMGGYPINPMVQILFTNTPQREFQFDLMFAPSTQAETGTLSNIIHTLRREAAPEPVRTGLVPFWKAPSSFDITFLHNGKENLAIPKIQECVLTQINVDYAPQGPWATFTNGYPVSVRMTLTFRERYPNGRDRIDLGY